MQVKVVVSDYSTAAVTRWRLKTSWSPGDANAVC